MPLFEIQQPGGVLKPFRQLHGGAELYESEIESLLWDSLEDLTGEALFPVARQPNIRGGGRPDIVALTREGRVVVIEVKRDVDRGQLAQCLEYAGWARTPAWMSWRGSITGRPSASSRTGRSSPRPRFRSSFRAHLDSCW
jgi:hypothetical protein